ncbi:MAG TPA: hypothetical protein PLI57_05610 [Spirochaetota bacterium]|nr:hypothetical protein [Spirochaetota bacterium]
MCQIILNVICVEFPSESDSATTQPICVNFSLPKKPTGKFTPQI